MKQDDHREEPQPKPEVERNGPRKPPRRTAVGLGDYKFKPGQNVVCKILKEKPGGYAVVVYAANSSSLPGYLPSDSLHLMGEELLATYVMVDNNRLLLAERHGAKKPKRTLDALQQLPDGSNET